MRLHHQRFASVDDVNEDEAIAPLLERLNGSCAATDTPNLASACFMVDAIVTAIDQLSKRVFVGLLRSISPRTQSLV